MILRSLGRARTALGILIWVLSAQLFTFGAAAHRTGEGYIFLNIAQDSLGVRVEMTIRDLRQALALDDDGNGEISDAEMTAHFDEYQTYVLSHIAVGEQGRDYRLRMLDRRVETHNVGRFAVIDFVADGIKEIPDQLDVEYRALFEAIENHRGLMVVTDNVKAGVVSNEALHSLIFTPDSMRQTTDLTQPPSSEGFISFVKHGIWHIWIGIDHVLFIIALLMALVLPRATREANQAQPFGSMARNEEPVRDDLSAKNDGFLRTLLDVAGVVTVFTLAHSITLTVAALGYVDLSSRVIESVIALSVLLAALNNIWPIFRGRTWIVVFFFGLFHGFGFATVLGFLAETQRVLVKTLLAFNIGVEIGQLAIIVVAFPLLFAIRNSRAYRRVLLPGASIVIALLAARWFVQRAFESA